MMNQNEVDRFLYQSIEDQDIERLKKEEAEREVAKTRHIKAQLFIKKTYAFCLFIACIDSIFNKVYKPSNYENVELILHAVLLAYVFVMEVAFKKQY